jgi:ATP phosphoribosyltransferase regulatory subunit/ATP phosphoribosyltransferase
VSGKDVIDSLALAWYHSAVINRRKGLHMKRFDKITPEGTKDYLFNESKVRKEITDCVHSIFIEKGFHQVVTPGFEFNDVFSGPSSYYPQESMFKSIDNKGRIMVARPDSTIPIARLVCSRLKDYPMPLKLYYEQRVFRNNPVLKGLSNEMLQMGVELIGDASFEADVELLLLSLNTLSSCTSENVRIEMGHIGIFKLLMERINIGENRKSVIHQFISTKNYAALSAELDKIPMDQTASILRELPKLFGSREVFDKAKILFDGYDSKLLEMLNYLESVYDALSKLGYEENIIIDFGLVNQADYYSSMVFKGYISSAKEAVLSGGRYDNLLKDFGCDFAATGFAINVDQIATVILNKNGKDRVRDKENKLRIALTKGRLEEKAIELFERMGFDCRCLKDKGRKLFISIPEQNIEVVFGKAGDVITYVEHGVCDMGVVGMDTILEHGGSFYEVLDLGFGRCRFALASIKGEDFYSGYAVKKVATKYPNVTRDFFEEKGMDVQIIKIEGSVELAPLLALADGIVDLVETGTTLSVNGLEVIDEIKNISARLIINETSMKLKKKSIDVFIDNMAQNIE